MYVCFQCLQIFSIMCKQSKKTQALILTLDFEKSPRNSYSVKLKGHF